MNSTWRIPASLKNKCAHLGWQTQPLSNRMPPYNAHVGVQFDIDMDYDDVYLALVQHTQLLSQTSFAQLMEHHPASAAEGPASGVVQADAIILPETASPHSQRGSAMGNSPSSGGSQMVDASVRPANTPGGKRRHHSRSCQEQFQCIRD